MRSLVLALLVSLAACGAPSAVDVCNTTCDKTGNCQGETPDQIQTCKNGCSMSAALYANCKNESAVLSCLNNCTQQSCAGFPGCQDACPKCMQ